VQGSRTSSAGPSFVRKRDLGIQEEVVTGSVGDVLFVGGQTPVFLAFTSEQSRGGGPGGEDPLEDVKPKKKRGRGGGGGAAR